MLDQKFVISVTYPNTKAEYTLSPDETLVRGRRGAALMSWEEADRRVRTTLFRGAEVVTVVPAAA